MSKDLESLHVSSPHISEIINGKFHGLKEICLPWEHSPAQIDILSKQKMNKLQRVHFRGVGKYWKSTDYMMFTTTMSIGKCYQYFDCIILKRIRKKSTGNT